MKQKLYREVKQTEIPLLFVGEVSRLKRDGEVNQMKSILLSHIIITCFFIISCNNKATTENSKKILDQEDNNSQEIKNRIERDLIRIDSLNKTLNWKRLSCGLWINKNKEIALKNGTIRKINEKDFYITDIESDGLKRISDIIDTTTFQKLKSIYYKDKNNIYLHPRSQNRSFFKMTNVDYESFEVINECYAKDKNNIFCGDGKIINGVDIKTFEVFDEGRGCWASDINNVYHFDRIETNKENIK